MEVSPQPLISFVIPYYNVPAEMLRACINSIVALPLNEDEREIIIIDDGSQLPAAEITSGIDAKLNVIRQPNAGPGMARNAGIHHAHGLYLQFVDSDDLLLLPGYAFVLQMIRERHADAVLFTWTRSMTPGPTPVCETETSGAEYVAHNNIYGSPCHFVFRRALLGHLRFPGGIFHEDEAFTPRLLVRANRLLQTNAVAYYYRERAASTMTRHTHQHYVKRLNDLFSVIKQLHRDSEMQEGLRASALKRRTAQLTMDYIYQVVILLHSWSELKKHTAALEKCGLYPLPSARYTLKYRIFSTLSSHRIGLFLLYCLLPLMKREK